ncbi:hypothetical protein Csa_007426 [Cucumis sativus]|nr:hypothetical protein Csa_007426 [Cucumis sativus]
MEDHHIIHHDQWSNDELLALLRIRSNIENCFPNPLGNMFQGNGKPDDGGPTLVVVPEEGEEENQDKDGELHDDDEEEDLRNDEMRPGRNEEERNESSRSSSCQKSKKKRKMMRQKEFELLKGYCEEIVKKMMIQQEEIHSTAFYKTC